MGREIRKVPAGWEHPKKTQQRMNGGWVEDYTPLYDEPFEAPAQRWLADMALWLKGEHEDQTDRDPEELAALQAKYPGHFLPKDYLPTITAYSEYCGEFPDMEYYRPDWTEPADHYQMYETVSEGTPVSPVFATKQELQTWLTEVDGYSPEAAEKFVEYEYAPTFMVVHSSEGVDIRENLEGLV